MRQLNTGMLVVSLDFELLWGVCYHETANSFKNQIVGARTAIPKLLDLFRQYHIHATWGTVGMLMAENKNELVKYIPSTVPQYKNEMLSTYSHMRGIGDNEQEDIYHYAHSLISNICASDHQELASHTFSHYYCKAEGATLDTFREDLLSAKKIAKDKFNVELCSLIFPRNSFTEDHVRIAKECGFSTYRGNPENAAYSGDTLPVRAIRLIDTYIDICGKKSYAITDCRKNGIVNVRASSFFRKYNTKLRALEWLKVQHIKKQMLKAARQGEIFHLWWHPHNIGSNLDKCLEQLEDLFKYYEKLNRRYGFSSKNMKEISEIVHQ